MNSGRTSKPAVGALSGMKYQLSFVKIWHVMSLIAIATTSQDGHLSVSLSLKISQLICPSPCRPSRMSLWWPLNCGKSPCTTMWKSCTRSAALPCFKFISTSISLSSASLHRSARPPGSSWLRRSQAWLCQVRLRTWRQRLPACSRLWVGKILGDM